MEPGSEADLREQIAELRERMQRLEETLQDYGIALRRQAVPGSTAEAAAEPEAPHAEVAAAAAGPAPETAARPYPTPAPSAPHFPASEPAAHDDASLESRIGSQWFNRIGILAVLIAAAWFLKLAIDNHWIGPLGRVLIGLIAGAGLIAWSERFRTRGYAAFSYSLKAIGSGVLYLSLWAAFSLYHLVGSPVAFAAMIAVTAFNGFLAWQQDAELLALYAIVGGFSTPLLLSTGENHEVALFTYLLLLNLAVLALVALKPWSRLLCAAFLGSVFFFVSWSTQYYAEDEFATTAFFLACFFLIFAWAPRLVRLDAEGGAARIWDNLALVVVPLVNAGLGFFAYYLMINGAGSGDAMPWVAVAFAAFYLLLLRLPARGAIRGSAEATSTLHLTIAVVFLTIAIPLKTRGRWLTVGWLAEGAALIWLARRVESGLLRFLAVLCLALGLIALVTVNPPASLTPIFNERFATYLFAILVCALVAWLAARAPHAEADRFAVFAWPTLALMAGIAVNALILLAVGWEIHSFWWYLEWRGNWTLMHDYRMYAQFTYSAFFMLFGAALLTVGFWRKVAFLRWQGLILLAVTIAKVFILDTGQLRQGYRILSFLGLGALLLAVSFVYQRDWLNLKKANKTV